MKTLPNGVTIFNSTPHVIRFWSEDWDEPVEVETDEVISAAIKETVVKEYDRFTLVKAEFVPQSPSAPQPESDEDLILAEGAVEHLIDDAHAMGADVIVGSIIAAQTYPSAVVAMCPCEGYERVPPAEKRMRPDKFTTF